MTYLLLCDFAQLDAFIDHLLDETTILRFRYVLHKHDLTEAVFDEVQAVLLEKNLLLKQCSMVRYQFDRCTKLYEELKDKRRDPNYPVFELWLNTHFGWPNGNLGVTAVWRRTQPSLRLCLP